MRAHQLLPGSQVGVGAFFGGDGGGGAVAGDDGGVVGEGEELALYR